MEDQVFRPKRLCHERVERHVDHLDFAGTADSICCNAGTIKISGVVAMGVDPASGELDRRISQDARVRFESAT